MSAPVSTRKENFDTVSNTDIEPWDTELRESVPDVTDARRWRFPRLEKALK